MAANSSPEWRSRRETSLGDNEQPRMEIMKGDKPGTQHGGGSQEVPRMEIMKGDKLGTQARAAQNGDHEGRQAWKTRRQRQPRAGQNGDHEGGQMKGEKAAPVAKSSPGWRSTNEGKQGGSGITTTWRFWGSATQSLRSKNPYGPQLSGKL